MYADFISLFLDHYTSLTYFSIGVTTCYLLLASIVDIRTYRIPNVLTGIYFVLLVLGITSYYFFPTSSLSIPLHIGLHIMGAVVGFLLLFIPAFIKNTPMGGDIKLLTCVGFLVGPLLILFITVIATFVNLVFGLLLYQKNKDTSQKIPFAPFAFVGFLFVVVGGWL